MKIEVSISLPRTPIIDFLRSKNFNLPYMGKDLVKEGIAILQSDGAIHLQLLAKKAR